MTGTGKRPLIGITLDHEAGDEKEGSYSRQPWYALRQNYADCVSRAGGLALPLPHDEETAPLYAEMIDGLIVTGGDFDIDPVLFGDSTRHEKISTKDQRTAFELYITRRAMARGIPVLGICGGEQLLNVALGGTLIQHIPDSIKNALAHEQPNPRTEPGHRVSLIEDTLLFRIVGSASMNVNSAHHQAVRDVGENILVNAVAGDGVIEGIEDPRHKFCLGVQWHPEYAIDPGDVKIFQALIAAARGAEI